MKIESLQDAKKYLRENFEKGVECLCCGQYVKLYKFAPHFSMTRDLLNLYLVSKQNPQEEYFHRSRFVQTVGGNDFTKFRFWGLIQQKEKQPEENKRSSSQYKLTAQGRMFCEGLVKIPKYIYLYNNKQVQKNSVETDTTVVTIRDALGTEFDYDKLMGRTND